MALSLLLFVLGLLLLRETKTRWPARFLAALAALFFVLYSAAYYASNAITGQGIDEAAFFYTLYGLEGAGFGAYKPVIAKAAALILAGLLLAFGVFRGLRGGGRPGGSFTGRLLGFLAVFMAFAVHPASADLIKLTGSHDYLRQAGVHKLLDLHPQQLPVVFNHL